ncbi:MAG: hypothetical protein AB1489_12260 [Acidobacteriota bacterium]
MLTNNRSIIVRCLVCVVLVSSLLYIRVQSQTSNLLPIASNQHNKEQVAFPFVPLLIDYEYLPQYFLQWLDDDPQYQQIEASISDNKASLLSVILTEKGSGRRINYCNTEAKVKALTSIGVEARLAKIEYRTTNKFGQSPAHEFSFTDEHGQAILWHFTFAAPASERGAGLTPQTNGPGWILIYRDLGTAAGEGTMVQIGKRKLVADAWPEISAPPYFVAYRGVYAEGIGIATMLRGQQSWRVTESPKELNIGAQWTLVDDRGRTRQLRLTEKSGEELSIDEIGLAQPSDTKLSLKVHQTKQGFALSSIILISRNKTLRMKFTPVLDLYAGAPTKVAFQIDQNGRNKVSTGDVSMVKRDNSIQLQWQPKEPNWAKSRALNTTMILTATDYKVEVQ